MAKRLAAGSCEGPLGSIIRFSAQRKAKRMLAWGGFSDGRLYIEPKSQRPDEPVYDEPRYAVFPTKRDAKRAYQDVRRIAITVVSKRRKP